MSIFKWTTEPKGIYMWKSIIPDEYQEVEYIVSNGRNCCINTGIYPDREDFEVNFVFLNATSYSNDAYIFGTSASSSSPRLTIKLSATAGYYYVYINNNSWTAQTVGGWNLWLNTKHDVTIKANRANWTFNFKVWSVDTTVSYNPNVAYNTPIRFFCYQSDTSTIWAGDMKVYRFKLKNSWILVRDMIPCYRKSDWTIWMYDIVNDVFYSNVNSWTLWEWNDINGLPVKAVYLWTTKVRPTIIPDYLCLTANTAGSTVRLKKAWSPTSVSLETSTDWRNWSDYTIWDTITLSAIWDKVYWRNKSETDTWFSINVNSYYQFVMTWSISASWDTNYLLNKNSTTTLSTWCFRHLFRECAWLKTAPSLPATTATESCYQNMFYGCTWLTEAPSLPATTLANYCYMSMFYSCTALTTLPSLPATTLPAGCYYDMFMYCSNIKLSTSKTWSYQTAYRIPTNWTWTTSWRYSLERMFEGTWWTFAWTPTINTTYYTSNTVV